MKYSVLIILGALMVGCSSPKSIFTFEKSSNHAPTTVTFANQSNKATSYLWEFGDGRSSSEVNPQTRYIHSGKYSITLTAIKNKKQHMSTQEIFIDPPHDCVIEMQTSAGMMTIKLYDETPLHRDNFIKLAEEGFYEGTLFHRVIKGFMIQGGDPDSKGAPAGKRLGVGGPGYTVPAEFVDTLIHIKGALAAARQGDGVNPLKASSGSQFYIVQGRPVPLNQLDALEMQKGIKYTEQARKVLTTDGGTPFLDKDYTVFGKIIKGMEIIDAIGESQTDGADRPATDVKIISVKIIK
ncbi:MAG: peptidylprolyl isomerase [Saprospiraceae bacterium]